MPITFRQIDRRQLFEIKPSFLKRYCSSLPVFLSASSSDEALLASWNCPLYSGNIPQRMACGFLNWFLSKINIVQQQRNFYLSEAKEANIQRAQRFYFESQPQIFFLSPFPGYSSLLGLSRVILGALLRINMNFATSHIGKQGEVETADHRDSYITSTWPFSVDRTHWHTHTEAVPGWPGPGQDSSC